MKKFIDRLFVGKPEQPSQNPNTNSIFAGDEITEKIRNEFDQEWFRNEYNIEGVDDIDGLFGIYLDGARSKMFSPNGLFSEKLYLEKYNDVKKAVQKGQFRSGFEHYLRSGKMEGRVIAKPNEEVRDYSSGIGEEVNLNFDPEWYLVAYKDVPGELSAKGISAMQHYNTTGAKKGLSPNSWFDEQWYLAFYPDVKDAIDEGMLRSGFQHYIQVGRAEGRFPKRATKEILESKYPGVTHLKGLGTANALDNKLRRVPVEYIGDESIRLNFVMPTLDNDIMFGGYSSIIHLIKKCIDLQFKIRILISEDQFLSESYAYHNLKYEFNITSDQGVTVENISDRKNRIRISLGDRFVAYSAWDTLIASDLASCTPEKKCLILIQEDERIFHHHDAHRALIEYAYSLPHVALFNTADLKNYFQKNNLGIFSGNPPDENAVFHFEHLITQVQAPSVKELSTRKGKRLLFYARPEAHASRNLFEIGLLALKDAVKRGVFDRTWIFDGIGTLSDESLIELGDGCVLNLSSKLSSVGYAKILTNYDLGLSLMYAPHPGLVHYEMAAAGMMVVTNTYDYRDDEYFSKKSKNFISAMPTIPALSEAIEVAVGKVGDFESRIENVFEQDFNSWDEIFNDNLVNQILLSLGVPNDHAS